LTGGIIKYGAQVFRSDRDAGRRGIVRQISQRCGYVAAGRAAAECGTEAISPLIDLQCRVPEMPFSTASFLLLTKSCLTSAGIESFTLVECLQLGLRPSRRIT
jgi:hypothetical protein